MAPIQPHQNSVVKEVEPYSLFLCPEDFSTQNQTGIRKEALEQKGCMSFKECSARGKVCSWREIMSPCVLGREGSGRWGTTALGIPQPVLQSPLL